MSERSKIEWTDATWNPVRGCLKISPGCKHCYAETFAERFRGTSHHPFEFGFDPRLVPDKLLAPLSWRTPRTIFVNSMSDLFLDLVPDAYIEDVIRVMNLADWHTYQVLTKRADRLTTFLNARPELAQGTAGSRPHIWWGVSVEDRRYGVPRIERLRAASVRVRFLSVEPLLEELGPVDLRQIHWVIVGGESGPGARPMDASWVESMQRQCLRQGVPFFFKQWGGVQKSRAGRELDGKTYDQMPVLTKSVAPTERVREERLRMGRQILSKWVTATAGLVQISARKRRPAVAAAG